MSVSVIKFLSALVKDNLCISSCFRLARVIKLKKGKRKTLTEC